jgi:hypothetical protein
VTIDDQTRINEIQFQRLLEQALPSALGAIEVHPEPRFGRTRPDFLIVTADGRRAIVEAKSVTPATRQRLRSMINQLLGYRAAYREHAGDSQLDVDLVLAIPGILAEEQAQELHAAGISRILDGAYLRAAAPHLPWPEGLAATEASSAPSARDATAILLKRLDAIEPGKAQWSTYQKWVEEALGYLLSPPLSQPIRERANETRVNRRDVILPNYATVGFWHTMRETYEAHFVVADAKNYVRNVKKTEVLQIANYLTPHGAGLFGLIVCRRAADRSAEVTRREQWVMHRKMIVTLNDADMRQMFKTHAGGQDPAEVIRQKIEDFRLGF